MEGLVQATVLNAPVADQLGVGSAQVDLLIGQLEEGGILIREDAVGAELIEGSVFLLGTGAEVRTWLQRGVQRSHSDRKEGAWSSSILKTHSGFCCPKISVCMIQQQEHASQSANKETHLDQKV